MARASIRWIGLLLAIIFVLTLFTSWLSPVSLEAAHDVAADWRDSFHDNAASDAMNDKISTYAPLVYAKVHSWWHRLFPDAEELRGLQPDSLNEEQNPRCKVYTYYDMNRASEDTEALLLVWLKAWWAAGLFPEILTNESSEKNPKYADLHAKYDALLRKDTIDGILAIDFEQASGLLVSHYVFPMTTIDDPTLRKIRQCDPADVLTRYKESKDDILQGSKAAFRAVVKLLSSPETIVDKERIKSIGLEAIKGMPVREIQATRTFARYDAETVEKLYPNLYQKKPIAQQGKSFSFAKNQLALLINGHLQNNFLINYRGGIEALNPKLIPEGDFLSRPALRVAMELTRCNLTPVPKSCAPQHAVGQTKCFDCSQLISSAIIKPVDSYEPKNNTFFVGCVPHPFTTLALAKSSIELSARTVRDSSRDMWSRNALLKALPAHSGAIMGLIFMSESLFSNEDNYLPDSQIWQIYEEDHYDHIEFEVGFTLPELRKSLDQLAQTNKEKSKEFQDLISAAKQKVARGSDAEDKSLEIVEAWSQCDAGAHQLVRNHIMYKDHWLEQMKAQNRKAFVHLKLR